jgi:heme exporter protein C
VSPHNRLDADIVVSLHALANPARFLKLARPLTPALFWAGVVLIVVGGWAGLTQTPADYLQGETVRILYIHVPAAWLGMGGWSGIAVCSISYLVWRHPLAMIAARAIAVPGAVFAALCLVTGSIWGRPTWGTWWEWDGRLTSMLLLFFVYLGFMALLRADMDRGGAMESGGRIPALYGVAGSVLLPIIRYSVVWWNTLHQGESIGLARSSIDASMLWPLWFTLVGFSCFFASVVLMRMRTILAVTKAEARMRRMAR